MPWRFGVDCRRPCNGDHFPFHFHIDLYVDVRGIDVGVSEPEADHVDVVSGAQQMHGGGVTTMSLTT